ncbi:MAG: site-specific integrase [Candidatus Nanopelagicales bacterium]
MASISRIQRTGVWRARYRDRAGREHAKHFTRKVDAQRWLDSVTAAVVTGSYVDPRAGRVTLREFYAGWAERQVWAPTTARAMDLAVRSCSFADVPLGRVDATHVEAWVKAMERRGLAASTIKTRVQNVRAVLHGARKAKVIGEHPADGVQTPRVRRRDAAMRIPTPEQVGALLGADSGFAPFVALCAFAGTRVGEAAGLQPGDVDFLGRKVHVRRQVQRAGDGTVDVRLPKYGAERTVYVPDELLALLSPVVDLDAAWMFTRDGVTPWDQNAVGHRWRRTCRAAGVTGFRLHDLRHFFASGLIAAGCDVVTVQRALGHSSATTTLATYSHLWPTAEDRTRAAAGGLVRQVLGTPADYLRTGGASSGL